MTKPPPLEISHAHCPSALLEARPNENKNKFKSRRFVKISGRNRNLGLLYNLQLPLPKTLFLKDRKNNLYLVSVQFDKKFKMKDLCKTLQLSSGSLSFASENLLHDILGIHSGSVSPFALVNDHDKKVKCIIDVDILKHQMVYFPPLTNTALLGLSMEKFRKFMTVIKHEIIFISI